MEAISTLPSTTPQPIRSISLPTRVHPSSQRVEALLNHLKPHNLPHSVSRTTCFEAETIQNDLVVLAELYNCMEELFHSPQTQQALLHYQKGKLVEEALSGSVTLLDACSTSRDLLLALKEHVQTLQSAMRRRRGDSSIETRICEYDGFRKNTKKEIAKQLGAMKRMENKVNCFSIMGQAQDQHLIFLARALREASTITISIFRSLLLFLSMPGLRTKGSSMISKLKPMKLFSSEKEQKNTHVVDLSSLLGRGKHSDDAKVEVQSALRVLETLNVSIDGLDGGLDCIFRRIVQNRVSLLNMLAH